MSSNLNITALTTSQNNKEVTVNDAVGALDAALTEFLTSDFTSGNVTLTDAQLRENVCHVLDNVTTARVFDFTSAIKHLFIVIGATGNTNTATVTVGTTTETIVADEVKLMYTDGTVNGLFVISGGGGGGLSNIVEDVSPQLGASLDTNSFSVYWSKGADVASAAELLVLAGGNSFDVTGTATITSIEHTADAFGIGSIIMLHFDGVLTLTHHATDLFLPTAANITTAVGDIALFQKYASGDWRCISYQRADGMALVGAGGGGNVDVGGFVGGVPATSTIIMRFVAVRAVTIPSGMAGSQGHATTGPSSQTDFDVQKNGVSAGTMRFATSATTATFIAASPIVLAAGDRLDLVSPANLNTMSDVSWTITGT